MWAQNVTYIYFHHVKAMPTGEHMTDVYTVHIDCNSKVDWTCIFLLTSETQAMFSWEKMQDLRG